jgi:hypothetical protein
MATRKKKSESVTLDMPGTIGSAKLVFSEPKVVKGSHLTVTTYPDGRTELIWDDDALLRDVQKALTEYENSVKVNTTKTKRKKKNEA